jgi:7-keto-8-aminopelargonate synthetase-like enzyme
VIVPEPLQQVDRTYVRWSGNKLSYFSGCDYFRLSHRPELKRAALLGLEEFGLNVAASRVTTGNHVLYHRLEESLGRFFNAEAALLTSNGYTTNLIVAQGLAGEFSHVLLDDAAHPSLCDAAEALGCPILKFAHRSPSALNAAVRRGGPGAKYILLTDGMFSRDGSVAPLKEYMRILPRDACMLVDDAHGAGILGAHGRGTLEHHRVGRQRVFQTVTLSKAFGVFGGAILGSKRLRSKLIERSRLFVASTPLPLPLVNAAIQAVRILEREASLRRRLAQNAQYVRDAVRPGMTNPEARGPIIALRPAGATATAGLKRALLKAGIFPPFIKYPGGPSSGYFRFVISSEHTRAQLDALIEVLIREGTRFVPLG